MRTGLRVLGLGTVAFLASATFASAADLGGPPAPPYASYTPEFSWAGLYMGIHGGGGWGNAVANPGADFNVSGPYLGAQIGYNIVWGGNLVLGVEGDVSWSGIDGGTVGSTITHDINWFGTVRGRLGWTMGDWMPYVTGGWAYANATRANLVPQLATRGHSGWTAGAGVEWAFSQFWTLKAEYKYLAFGSASYAIGPTPSVNLNIHSAEIGLNYKF
jgi:outer membrane immunogenic protein